jgi:hypothetical protein
MSIAANRWRSYGSVGWVEHNAKSNTLNQSFFHPLDDLYVGSVALKENLDGRHNFRGML